MKLKLLGILFVACIFSGCYEATEECNDSTHEYDLDSLQRRFNSNDVYPVVGFSSTF